MQHESAIAFYFGVAVGAALTFMFVSLWVKFFWHHRHRRKFADTLVLEPENVRPIE